MFFLLITVFNRDYAGAAAISLPHLLAHLPGQFLPHLLCVFPRHHQIKDQVHVGLALHDTEIMQCQTGIQMQDHINDHFF